MRQEIERRQSHVSQLRAFFYARPMVWIDARDLEEPGGRQAWRTRVSELRRSLKKGHHGTIENRVLHHDTQVISLYRFLPYEPLGRSSDTPTPRLWTSEGPYTEEFKLRP